MPYEITNHTLWEQLYIERCRVGSIRQPNLAPSLAILVDLLKEDGLKNPYDGIPRPLIQKLCTECIGFEPGGQWHRAPVKRTAVFYRLEKCSSLITYHLPYFSDPEDDDGWGLGFGLPGKTSDLSDVDKKRVFKLIWDKYRESKWNWLPLSKLINRFQGKRNITWWTADFSEAGSFIMPDTIIGDHLTEKYSWLMELAFRVGMVNHWIDDQMVLMRIEAKYIPADQVGIPSIVDAFDQPIFDPITDGLMKNGTAIHIDNTLKQGYSEFVLGRIPIRHIDFIPVQINKDQLTSRYPFGQFNDQLTEQLVHWLSK